MAISDLPALDIDNPIITQSCRLPDGNVILKKPIIAKNLEQIHLLGGNRTRVRWQGDPSIGAIQYIGVRRGSIGGDGPLGFELVCERSGTNAGILIANSEVVGGFISTAIQVRNVHIMHGGSQVAFDKGFSIDSHIADPTGVHRFNNNENHRFFYCSVQSCLTAAYHIRGHQAYDISFRDCDGYDAGRIVSPTFHLRSQAEAWAEASEYKDNYYIAGSQATGWAAASRNWIYGVYIESGASAILKNCNFNRCEVDVFMGWPCSRVTFEGHNSEHSRSLISNMKFNPANGTYTPATSSHYHVHGRDIRMECEPKKGDGIVVRMWGRGPTTFTNSFFTGINGICPRFWFANYAKRMVPGGPLIPMRGVVDMNGVYVGQHGGRLPTEPIIMTPHTWTTRSFGCEHMLVEQGGSLQWRPIVANQPLQPMPDN